MYADYHQIYEIGKDTRTVLSQLQQSPTQAANWYDSNLLQGNLEKYQMMNIRNKRASNDKTCITVKGKTITKSESLRVRSIGKSGFRFRISDFGFPNKTRNPKMGISPCRNPFPRRISIKAP